MARAFDSFQQRSCQEPQPPSNFRMLVITIAGFFSAFAYINPTQALVQNPFASLREERNDGIHLAVHPQCGPLGGNTTDVNAGISLRSIKTIVSFGDSYTDGGKHDGSPLDPPVLIPPGIEAGGRSTDGPVWIEYIADDINARFMDYAISSAVVNISLWPDNPFPRDFLQQMAIFLNQSNDLDPKTTLYTVFFGINDWEDSMIDGDHLPEAAQDLLNQIQILASEPTNGRNFLVTDVYGRGTHTASGEAWKQSIFDGLTAFHRGTNVPEPLNVAFGDFSRIWDGVLGSDPGYQAFGYTSTDSCVVGDTTAGSCSDPKHYFYWISGQVILSQFGDRKVLTMPLHRHPSNETMRIMADYVEEVLDKCRID
ncbi:hypothetical protein EW146_g3673 [Bondarzewia mesenterica]|uniref:Uncharacterized protein n=1 Tax=Bondarzewia mesenterica TaxID=1095465 RepID=A0A4S4M2P5_9AGAM|nr:hypothetical protein EW146_g3673 [Bondarzewia mesenterica]